ncbi:hypothetical protein LDENG_00233310 [Lucifuga dentata]|nr:hypothetical protein LDENG_00233310 [Lucifuga dentata]
MHHQDYSGDPPGSGSRKTAFHHRRGSSGASASSVAGSSCVNTADDNPTQAGSSSPGLHHQPLSQVAGAQVKKKSGFQITSVTSAQINATDTGVPERSSSDETLNSLHGVDTPGLVSPNEPLHPHSISQQHTSMVNGTVHHHHHHYPQQHSQSHQQHGHHADNMGGAEPPLPPLTIAPLASSSPALVSKDGPNQSQRLPVLDNTKPTGPVGFDNTVVSGLVASVGGPSVAPGTQSQHSQTQTATGSRFRVVKLDTNSEPFRKGRWTCTEYYEKEIPHSATSEASKGSEVAAETEAGNAGVSPGLPAVQPPHTLQPYQTPSQDFTSPQAVQSPPQGLAQNTPLTYVPHQEVIGEGHIQKPMVPVNLPTVTPQVMGNVNQPSSVMTQQLPYAVDPHQAQVQGGYPTSQLHAGVIAQGSVRQPDFIQPTAPFQTQVQPPLPHSTTGISMTVGPGGTAQPPVTITQQLPHQGQPAPPAQASFAAGQPQTPSAQPQQQQHPQAQAHPSSTATAPEAHIQGSPYMPLTALQADLQPLLTPGTTLTQPSGASQAPGGGSFLKTSQLEDAQKLLLQHQSLLGLPKLGAAAGSEGDFETRSAGSLAHMGMAAEASALMAAAAAGLRTQHGEGDEER